MPMSTRSGEGIDQPACARRASRAERCTLAAQCTVWGRGVSRVRGACTVPATATAARGALCALGPECAAPTFLSSVAPWVAGCMYRSEGSTACMHETCFSHLCGYQIRKLRLGFNRTPNCLLFTRPAPVGARCPTEDVHLHVAPPTHVAVRETPFCIRIFPSEPALRAASARSFRHLLTCSYTQTCRFPHHTPSSTLEFIGPQRALAKRT